MSDTTTITPPPLDREQVIGYLIALTNSEYATLISEVDTTRGEAKSAAMQRGADLYKSGKHQIGGMTKERG